MLNTVPLTILPLVAYNLVGYGLSGADPWATRLFGLPMMSGAVWGFTLGDLLVLFALALLYVEVARLGRSRRSIARHGLSVVVVLAFLAQFLVAAVAAHSVFVMLMAVALFDMAAGFALARPKEVEEIVVEDDLDSL